MLFKTKNGELVQSSIYKDIELLNFVSPCCPDSSIEQVELIELQNKRKELLDEYRKKQPFRVSVGKSKWIDYNEFKPEYNLREILNDEIVIEFDSEDRNSTWEAINQTAINLYQAGYSFEIWDHNGRSPHLHIHNLPILDLNQERRQLFKKIFIRKYVPLEYLGKVDISLTGIHLVAIEFSEHWKKKYGIKKLIHKFNLKEDF